MEQEPYNDSINRSYVEICLNALKEILELASKIKNTLSANFNPCDNCKIQEAELTEAIARIGLSKSDTKEVQAVAECLRAVEDIFCTQQ